MIEKNWNALSKPKKIEIKVDADNPNVAILTAKPLEKGFGHTIGTALRRILLSSLQGCAPQAIKIDGVQHEFSSIPGVKEDVPDIILNLKNVYFQSDSEGQLKATIKAKGPVMITSGMIDCPNGLKVVNEDVVLCNLAEGATLNMEITLGQGKGYVPADQNASEGAPLGTIAVDSIYSPILNVGIDVSETRVGQRVDFDQLILTVKTNGTISPEDAVAYAARIMVDQMNPFINFEDVAATIAEDTEKKDLIASLPFNPKLLKHVEELELSVRANNCLKNDHINYIGELVQKSENDMLKTPNFGRKSLNEIKTQLETMGLGFGMNVPGWPPENIAELSRKFENPYK
ncbi:MAG: DNA-directed RNA polymerase subunit alpha [Rickettsiales bacterium]|jgi:DNA-directed RNA polymerase subunit alpha|nr:DNA-directed RNA polymerase subunit alpha [Rickettsiales bacterium]